MNRQVEGRFLLRTLQQLLPWNFPNLGEVLRTLRKGMRHLFPMCPFLRRPPCWWMEGAACWYTHTNKQTCIKKTNSKKTLKSNNVFTLFHPLMWFVICVGHPLVSVWKIFCLLKSIYAKYFKWPILLHSTPSLLEFLQF